MHADENVPTSAGLSSFNLLDTERLFTALDLQAGMSMLDFGCGLGNYSIEASPYIGDKGWIMAVDPWEEGIETLAVRASLADCTNIQTAVCGAGQRLPLENQSVDICLLATVLHILVLEQMLDSCMEEIFRVARPDCVLAAVEFFKKEGPPGPPLEWRLSHTDLEEIFAGYNLAASGYFQVGLHNYLSLFTVAAANR